MPNPSPRYACPHCQSQVGMEQVGQVISGMPGGLTLTGVERNYLCSDCLHAFPASDRLIECDRCEALVKQGQVTQLDEKQGDDLVLLCVECWTLVEEKRDTDAY